VSYSQKRLPGLGPRAQGPAARPDHRRPPTLDVTASGVRRHDTAAEHLARLLDLDPYDEPAHEQRTRALVAARRHGEAQQADERYRAAMAQLGIRLQVLLTAVPANQDQKAI
jgi:Tfp pilus assembly protein PilF